LDHTRIIGDRTMKNCGISYVVERHKFWWEFLLEHCAVPNGFDTRLPKIEWFDSRSDTAAFAGYYDCKYNLRYVLSELEEYDTTVCHEICHTFTKRVVYKNSFIPRKKDHHGQLWSYFYNVVCGAERGRYHNYKRPEMTEEVKALREVLRLKEKIKKLAAEIKVPE